MLATCVTTSSAAFAVWVASAFTSPATTAKPRGLTRASRLNGRVQGEEVGLARYIADELHDCADPRRGFLKLMHHANHRDRQCQIKNRVATEEGAATLDGMSDARIFRYFKTSPEIIRLAVMMYVCYPL